MRDLRPEVVNTAARALCQRLGCYDAVAMVISTATGASVSKGTISQRIAGQLEWPVTHVIALENALGVFPITNMMSRRIDGVDVAVRDTLAQLSGSVAKEAGEAVEAMLKAFVAPDATSRARAVTEIDEAIEALQRARSALMEGGA